MDTKDPQSLDVNRRTSRPIIWSEIYEMAALRLGKHEKHCGIQR
jgi:hypothetical protein